MSTIEEHKDGSLILKLVTDVNAVKIIVQAVWDAWVFAKKGPKKGGYNFCSRTYMATVAINEVWRNLGRLCSLGWHHDEYKGQIQVSPPNNEIRLMACSSKKVATDFVIVNEKGELTRRQVQEENKRFHPQLNFSEEEIFGKVNAEENTTEHRQPANLWIIITRDRQSDNLEIYLVLPYDMVDDNEKLLVRDRKRIGFGNLIQDAVPTIEWIDSVQEIRDEHPDSVMVIPPLKEVSPEADEIEGEGWKERAS